MSSGDIHQIDLPHISLNLDIPRILKSRVPARYGHFIRNRAAGGVAAWPKTSKESHFSMHQNQILMQQKMLLMHGKMVFMHRKMVFMHAKVVFMHQNSFSMHKKMVSHGSVV